DAGDSAVVDAGDSGPPDAGDAGSADAAVPRLCGTGDCEPQVIAAGWSHTCAALNDSRLVCWGRNNQGQLGREPTGEAFPRPAAVPDLSVTPSAFFPPRPDYLGAGSEHTCVVVDDDGPTMCFGANADWQVRAMGPPRSSVPLEGMRSGGRLSVGGAQACLVSAPATICWGRNDRGQLGNGGTMSPLIVSLLPLPDGSVVRDLSLGADHGCATIMTAGIDFRVHCWGVNDLGQVGDGTNAQRESPVPITSAGTGALVAAGHDHSCYATAAGEVLCWGPRALGDTPHAVADLPPVDAIAAGDGFTCALSAGSVWCWGSNVYGQLGTGTTGGTAGPSRVPGIDFAAQLAVGRFHVCVVEDVPGDAPARILCWGRNDHGQLGDGTTEDRASPVNVVAE
ncbi:MAG: hypothetical protein IT379_22105, partial [Deltaproteobacteria bacterium]|nr:hypothetical protein [Deltaproteobacteria bacterium]